MWKRLISFALYPALMGITLVLLMAHQYMTTNSGIIPLEPGFTEFNYSSDPKYIVQISDIHYSPCYDTENPLRTVFSIAQEQLKSDFVVLSGDMTDNYNKCTKPACSSPVLDHWIGYERALNASKLDQETIFEVLGNHDMWGIYEFNENQYCSKFVRSFNKSNFYSYSQTKNGLRVVAFQPQDFPSGHGPNCFMPIYRSHMIDKFQEEIEKLNDEKIDTIVVSHFPRETCLNFYTKSKKGETFSSLLKKHNVLAHITGHTHPKRIEVRHIDGDYVEFTSSAFKRVHGFVLLTIDNGQVNYEFKDLYYGKDYAILTSPSPSKFQRFTLKNEKIPIRLISFSGSKDKNFTVSGAVNGKLSFEKFLKENVAIYSLKNAAFKKGENYLKISGDYDYEMNLTVGTTAGPFREPRIVNVSIWWMHLISFFFYSYLVLIVIGFWRKFNTKGHEILLGPLTIGNIIYQTRFVYKLLMTIFFVWPFILPTMFYQTQNRLSSLWIFGMMVSGRVSFDLFGYLAVIFYHVTVYLIFIDVSVLIVKQKFAFSKIWCDLFINTFLFLLGSLFWYRYGTDIGYKYYWISSFTFSIIPICFIFLAISEHKFNNRRFKID